jgi:hypothetical protein
MSDYCSYGDFCNTDLQIKKNSSETHHRHHINCTKCNKMLEPNYKNAVLYDCDCLCARDVKYSCPCGNTFKKDFDCVAPGIDDDEYEVEYASRPKFEQYSN